MFAENTTIVKQTYRDYHRHTHTHYIDLFKAVGYINYEKGCYIVRCYKCLKVFILKNSCSKFTVLFAGCIAALIGTKFFRVYIYSLS